jgi:hypothetical protein
VQESEAKLARRALRGYDRAREHPSVVITRVQPVPFAAWPPGWEDVEVVDSVLVAEPPAPRAAAPAVDAGVYDRSGRVPAFQRFGRIVSVVA